MVEHDILVTIALGGVLCVAAISDARSRKIPNALILAGLSLSVAIMGLHQGFDGISDVVAGFFVGFMLMLPGFLLGFTGAGDVKLLGVVGSFVGVVTVVEVFAVTALLGASAVVILRLLRTRDPADPASVQRYGVMMKTFFVTREVTYLEPPKSSVMSRRLPLAPFMFAAVLIALARPLFGG